MKTKDLFVLYIVVTCLYFSLALLEVYLWDGLTIFWFFFTIPLNLGAAFLAAALYFRKKYREQFFWAVAPYSMQQRARRKAEKAKKEKGGEDCV